ncbi:hypothetical protein [Acanthopleuribacter pedis]|uniref:TrbL/VirB6 plasmid conjugal transfer protein n=1 Tax=Acanthopleuribacter pedis TaxID=442870 RepID=A0A8J7U7U9_9BACT|nr:hypothetical protein [Acanthopleuribacter pedis]MBO1323384.1 hypothetical protein [Acanthopleuribacter pedis]
MNYDPIYYHMLTPLILSYKGIAGSVYAASFIFHWLRGAWHGANNDAKGGFHYWKSAGLSLLVYTLCFVPLPNPGELIGFQDAEVVISETQFGQTTVAIFLIERLSYGADTIATGILSWDVSIKAQENLGDEFVSGKAAVVKRSRAPNDAEIIYNFIIFRAQYLQTLMKNLWSNEDLEAKGIPTEPTEDGEPMGTWDLLKSFSAEQMGDYLVKQISLLFYNLVSSLGMIAAFIILLGVSLVMYLLAGLVKYAAIYVAGIFFLLLPWAWFINGKKCLSVGFNMIVVYLPLKTVIVIVIWMTFFMIEAIQLQAYREVAADYPILTEIIQQYRPGFLYTEAGRDILYAAEKPLELFYAGGATAKTLLSMIVCLLCMIYIVIKTPSLIGAMLGLQSIGDDLFTSFFFIAGAASSAGATLKAKAFSKKTQDSGNVVYPEQDKPGPATRHE